MDFTDIILKSLAALGGLGLVLGLGLAIASKFLAVKSDPKIEQIRELLPGANCGACGFPGCDGFAKALAAGEIEVAGCSVVSADSRKAIADLLGVAAGEGDKKVARVLCQGGKENCPPKYTYSGISDCRSALAVGGGPSGCRFGCDGLMTCAKACPFDAIYKNDKGIAEVDEEKCTSCGKCITACPKSIIKLMPQKVEVYARCNSKDKGKAVISVCKTGCNTCMLCVKKCPQGAITMVDNLPVIDYDKCDNCGTCVAVCPKNVFAGTPAVIEKKTKEAKAE